MLAIVPHTSSITDARPAVDAVRHARAKRILADPYLLGLTLFPANPFSIYDRPIENIRFNIQDRIRASGENARADARDGGKRFQFSDLEALQQAALALEDDRAWAVAMKRWR